MRLDGVSPFFSQSLWWLSMLALTGKREGGGRGVLGDSTDADPSGGGVLLSVLGQAVD